MLPPEPNTKYPDSFPGWLRFLWQRVFFPGEAGSPGPASWKSWFLLIIIPGILLYPCTSFYLFEPDEGRYAQIAREMLVRGEWVVPYLQSEPYLDKPPLFYWLVMASFSVFGFHDWAARLVPAVAVHLTILMTYLFGRRVLGEKPAFWGALTLTLAPGFIGMGRLLILDGLFTFWIALSLFAAFVGLHSSSFNKWWTLAALACGLGILTKGPAALILSVPPLWLYCWLTEKVISPKSWIAFAGLVLGVNLPWYLAVSFCLPEFAGHFFWEHNVLRFVQPFDHPRPVWFYGPILLVGFLPATLLLVPFGRFIFSAKGEVSRGRCPQLGFLLLAGFWCVFFFSLSGCKLPTYILPAFPPLALAFGCFLVKQDWPRSRWVKGTALATLVVLALGHYVWVPYEARRRSPMNPHMLALCGDPGVPVLCFPRNIDSAAFYLGRSDLYSFRSKHLGLLLQKLQEHPRTVVLCSHFHSLKQLRENLPENLEIVQTGPLGLCDLAVVEKSVSSSCNSACRLK